MGKTKTKKAPTGAKKKKDDNTELVLGAAAVGGILYYLSRKKGAVISPDLPIATSSAFPLKKGATGPLVVSMQKALIAKGGTIASYINNTGGADGKFGAGTESALKAAGYPIVVTEADYNKLTATTTSTGLDYIYSSAYTQLWSAVGTTNGQTVGTKLLITLPPKVYVGIRTAVASGNFIKVRASFNNVVYYFWVDVRKTVTFKDLQTASSQGYRTKSEEEVRDLLKYLNG